MDKLCSIMKKIYLLVFVFLGYAASSQSIATSHTMNAAFFANGAVCFNFQNTSTTDVLRLKEVSSVHWTDASGDAIVQVWYKPSAITTTPTAITAANGWIAAGVARISNIGPTVSIFMSSLHIDVPVSSTYGIVITSSSFIGFEAPAAATTYTFSSGAANLLTGTNISYGGIFPATVNAQQRLLVGGISFLTLADCGATMLGGEVDAIQGFCGTVNKTYTLKNNTQGKGIAYQWQTGTSATGPWTNAGTNSPILNRTISATTYLRCRQTCTATGAMDSSAVFADTINPFYLCYCASVPVQPSETKIDSMLIMGTKTGSSSGLCQIYTDYRSKILPIKVRVGTTLNASLRDGSCLTSNLADNGVMYFDINQNGVFDAAERLGTAQALVTGRYMYRTLAIPFGTAIGRTGFRAMVYNGTTAPTSPCGPSPATGNSWGEVEDYLVDIIQDPIDARMNTLFNADDRCSGTTDSVKFSITNMGSSTINPLTVSYSINGGAPVTETFGTIASAVTQTFAFSTLADYTGLSTINLKVWHSNAQDTNLLNDTLVSNFKNFTTPDTPVVTNIISCLNSPLAIMKAVSTPPAMTRWYSDAPGTNEIATGDKYIVTNPTANLTVYAKSVLEKSGKVGLPIYPVPPGIPLVGLPGLTSPGAEGVITTNGSGIVFDVLRSKVTINSVKVKFNTGGNAIIEIRNSANTLLKSIPWAVSQASMETVIINYALPAGTGYRILLATNPGSVGATLGYNTYPLTIPNVISLTSSIFTGGYNTFYDWDISYDACVSNLVPVTITYDGTVNSPVRVLPIRDTACTYPDYVLNAGNNGASYLWHDGSGNQSIVASTTGMYRVTITNSRGCTIEDTSNILITPSPFFTFGPDQTVCFGTPLVIKSGYTNRGFNHIWSIVGDTTTFSLEPELEIKASGQYALNILNTGNGCGFVDTIKIVVVPIPAVFLGRDTFACNNAPIVINAPSGALYSYKWDDGTTTATRTLTASKKVWIEVSDPSSGVITCKNSDTVNVFISTIRKPFIGLDKTSCNAFETIGIVDTPGRDYRWNTGESTSKITKSASGIYRLTVSESGTTCTYSDTMQLTMVPNLPLDLGPTINTCDKKVIIRANKGFTGYVWNPNLSNKDTIAITSTSTVSLTATSPCGAVIKSVTVNILDTIQDFNLPPDTFICGALVLSVPSQPAGNEIRWSTGDSMVNTITVNQTGNYWVRIKNACSNYSDAINVVKDTLPIADFEYSNYGTFVAFDNRSLHAKNTLWEFGNAPSSQPDISTTRNASFAYDTIKTVTVTLTVENSCGEKSVKTKVIDLSVDGTSGITSSNGLNRIEVYPNPTSDNIYVRNMDKSMNNANITIYAMDGKIVMARENTRLAQGIEYGLNVSNLNSGSYLLIINNDKESIRKKISITK